MNKTFKIAYMGLLGAAAVALSFLEGLLPPLPFLPPGAKAGFSNVITMFAASHLGLGATLTLCLMKSLFVLLTRGFTAFCMSLCGGLLSALVAYLCLQKKQSLLLTGIFGAITHNTAQLLVAMAITQTPYLFFYSPVLLIFAIISGSITGVLLGAIYKSLCHLEKQFSPKGES